MDTKMDLSLRQRSLIQTMFNKVYRGMYRQGFEKSCDDSMSLYRGPCGRKCTIGHLITDKSLKAAGKYEEVLNKIEGKSIATAYDNHILTHCIAVSNGLSIDEVDVTMKNFFTDLQEYHDDASTPEVIKRNLHHMAHEWELKIPKV